MHSEEQASPDSITAESSSRNQFGIAAIFWITFIVGLGLTYLKRFDSTEIVLNAIGALIIGMVIGGLAGSLTGSMRDAFFWSTLIAAFGYISTASDPRYTPEQCFVWATLGAVVGALASTLRTQARIASALICGAAAAVVMLLFCVVAFGRFRTVDLSFDVFMAPFIGITVAIFVQMITWLEHQRQMPRYITATWLLAAVIVGNLISH